MHILELPDDSLVTIFLQLDAENLATMERVCKTWFNVALEAYRHLVLYELQVPPDQTANVKDWRRFYYYCMCRLCCHCVHLRLNSVTI